MRKTKRLTFSFSREMFLLCHFNHNPVFSSFLMRLKDYEVILSMKRQEQPRFSPFLSSQKGCTSMKRKYETRTTER